jgi:hypothetical protein
MLDDYDAQIDKNAEIIRKKMIAAGLDTSKLDYWLNKP